MDVEFEIPRVRVQLVDDRRVHPLGQRLGPAQVGRDEDEAVGARQVRPGEGIGVAGRRVGDGRRFGLRLVEQGQRAAA